MGDAVPAVLIPFVMFCVPMFIPRRDVSRGNKAPALLDWQSVHKKFPWSIIFMIGGGYALADACEVVSSFWSAVVMLWLTRVS